MKNSDFLNASEQFDGNNAFPLLAPVNVFLYLVTTARIVNMNRGILRMSQLIEWFAEKKVTMISPKDRWRSSQLFEWYT